MYFNLDKPIRIKENDRFQNEIKFIVHTEVVPFVLDPAGRSSRKQLDGLEASCLKKTSPEPRHW